MKHDRVALYVHLIWATWDRLPLIAPSAERAILREIENEARSCGCRVLALNGMSDHVHLVVSMPPKLAVSDLVKQVKGASSRLANSALSLPAQFKWQGHYCALSVSRSDLDRLLEYVKRQKERHGSDEIYAEWEQTFIEVPATAPTPRGSAPT